MRTPGPSRESTPAGVSSHSCPHCSAPGDDTGDSDWTVPAAGPPGMPRRRRRRLRRTRRLLAVAVVLGLLGGIMFAGLLIVAPSVANAPALALALEKSHHAVYPGQPVPDRFAASLVATEDHGFYSEAGIDPFAFARMTGGSVMGKPDQDGSTLNQQLAKLLYVSGRSGTLAKAEQILLGVKLALSYPKAEILQMYSSVAYFGHGYYGLRAASCGYFAVAPAALTWPQAALLAGLVQAPTADDPLTHLTLARAGEAHVLNRLAAMGKLTQTQAERAYQQPLHLTNGHARCASRSAAHRTAATRPR
jgi:membrane peptidoglycan carboxypeptidase